MNKIWSIIILVSLVYGVLNGRGEEISRAILNVPTEAFKLSLSVIGSAVFFNGVMKVMDECNVTYHISLFLKPLLKKILPKLEDQKALNYISVNIAANLFGLGYAATPSGLLGMKRLSEISKLKKDIASDEMVIFLVLNTAGVTLVPTTTIALRQSLGSKSPADFMFIGLIGTFVSCLGGLVVERLLRREVK